MPNAIPDSYLPAPDELALATDLYQLTMMAAYRARRLEGESVFELFVRRMPAPRGFLVAAGLEQALAYLRGLRFTKPQIDYLRSMAIFADVDSDFFAWLEGFRFEGTVDAVPEGTVVFPNEPLLSVRAPIAQAQLIETFLLATINMQTLIATKAARVRLAAGDKRFVDFGARRAHGFGAAMLATRAAWIAGADGTSNVLAGHRLGIPVLGTAAHAFIMSFEREEDAFALYHRLFPDHCTLLVDTYDTLEGCRRASAIGPGLAGVRLDSGDLGELAFGCRKILDDAGLSKTKIVASGDLNEDSISELVARGAPIDSFGVGTELVTSRDGPALSGVYKLVERHEGGERVPVMKLSPGKVSWPGQKQIFRVRDAGGTLVRDVIELAEAAPPEAPPGGSVTPLLVTVMREGALTGASETWDVHAARARCLEELPRLPEGLRRLHDFDAPPTTIGPALQAMADGIRARIEAADAAEGGDSMSTLHARTTVFIDVDTQIDFIEPHGALYVPGAELLKPCFSALLEAARAVSAPVVASADAHLPNDPEFGQFPPHCLAGSVGQRRVPETEPEQPVIVAADGTLRVDPGAPGGTIVLEKVAFDLFTNPAADEVLRETGADTAVVFGVALDYCVRAAALGLRERGYRTLVVRDATAPVTAEGGERAHAELAAAGVEMVSTAEVVAALR